MYRVQRVLGVLKFSFSILLTLNDTDEIMTILLLICITQKTMCVCGVVTIHSIILYL